MLCRSATFLTVVLIAAACSHRVATRELLSDSRDQCRAAAENIAAGFDSHAAFATLGWCDESGPPAIALRWRRTLPSDTLALRGFLFASSHLRDGRVFDAVYSIVRDTARQRHERAAALLVLGAQLDSSARVELIPGVHGEPWRATLAGVFDGRSLAGSQSITSSARERVSAVVQALTNGQAGSIPRMAADPLYAAATEVFFVLEHLSPRRPATPARSAAVRERSNERWSWRAGEGSSLRSH